MKNISFIFSLFVLLSINIENTHAQTFVENTLDTLTGACLGVNEWGDYDNDGDLDVVVIGYSYSATNVAKLYKNNADGTFTEQTNITFQALSRMAAKWGDYDNDGDIDLLITGTSSGCNRITRIYKNNGNNSFSSAFILTGVSRGELDWGDYDNDGDLDIIITGNIGTNTNYAKVYTNNGPSAGYSFTELSTVGITGVMDSGVQWCDYDNDSYIDFAISGTKITYGRTKIYKNNGNSTFTIPSTISLSQVNSSTVAWGDYNNDGFHDLLVLSHNPKLYKNNGDGSFSSQGSAGLPALSYPSVSWGDYDSDGDLDLLICGNPGYQTPYTKVFKNIGNNSFAQDTSIHLPAVVWGNVKWVDFDNDGDLDISLSGQVGTNYISKIYKNQDTIVNQPPTTPTGLNSQQIGLKYLLTWNRSSDSITPSQTITYNIRIGSTDSTEEIKSSQSDLITGYHKVIEFGAIKDTFIYVEVPAACSQMGQYSYWSVQAIDNGYKASPFSVTDSISPEFNITVNNDSLITLGDSIQMSAIPNAPVSVTYNWSPSTGLSNPNISNPVASPLWNTTYYVTATYGSVVRHDSVEILVNPFREIQNTNITGIGVGATKWGDYDNDGDLDIFLSGNQYASGAGNSITKIYVNNGNNSFSQHTGNNIDAYYFTNADWGDYDNDGDLDLAICGSTSETEIYKNSGNLNLSKQTGLSIAPASSNGIVKWGDYDNDGDLDLLIADNSKTKLYRNNGMNASGNVTFTEQTNILLPVVSKPWVDWGDYDNDGDLDLLMSGSNEVKLLKNNGNNTFTNISIFSFQYSVTKTHCSWVDYNNDGILDIYCVFSYIPHTSKIYQNMGNNNFVEDTAFSIPNYYDNASKWADYDNDGDMDVIVCGYINDYMHPILTLYENQGDTSFTKANNVKLPYMGWCNIDWGDYDADGDLDILMTGTSGAWVYDTKIIENLSEKRITNTRPSVPLNFSVSSNNGEYVFSWNKSSDNNTNNKTITYNMSIGKNYNPNAILSAQSLNNGTRLLCNQGNMQLDTFAVIKINNPSFNQVYTAQIQSIDNSFYPSAFSAPISFTIQPQWHIIADKDTIYCGDSLQLNVVVTNGDSSQLTYSWSPSFSLSNNSIINPIAKPQHNTWYKVTLINNSGIISSDSIYIVVPDAINPNFTTSQTNNPQLPAVVSFTNTTTNLQNHHFTWYFGDSTILQSDSVTVHHIYHSPDQYTVTLKAVRINSSCSGSVVKYHYINCLPTSILSDTNNTLSFKVFPNPNKGSFSLIVNGGKTENYTIEVISMLGKIIFTETIQDLPPNTIKRIDLNNVAEGIYMVKLRSKSGCFNKMIIIKK